MGGLNIKKSWVWLLAMGVSSLALFPADVKAAGTILDQSRYGIVTKSELAELLKMDAHKKKADPETPAEFLTQLLPAKAGRLDNACKAD